MENNSVTLSEWVKLHPSMDEKQSVFLNMDRALKYIHEHGYCIEVFHPSEIHVLNNEDKYIQFRRLVELSKDPVISRNMIKEDIFNSAVVQIAIYSNITIDYINIDFIREQFDSFVLFLPQTDVPYYRGVIQRGASVYLCEFTVERRKRDLQDMEKELGEEAKPQNVSDVSEAEMINKKVNDMIYRQISGINDSAFASILIVPVVILFIVSLFILTVLIINFIG